MRRMIGCKDWVYWAALLFAVSLPAKVAAQTAPMRCADLSSLDELESGRAVFRDQGTQGDALEILKSHGLDTVRLRLFHSPDQLRDSLEDVLKLAKRAHDYGYKIVLNLHYSDTWADPGRQTKPAAWSDLPIAALVDSVYAHTARALAALAEQGTPPVLVQVGNEITTGMLWDTGRVGGPFDTPDQWRIFGMLLKSGILAVREHSSAQIMIHIDRGGDPAGARWFFDRLGPMDFDLIGLSYYPWWHGPLDGLRQTAQMAMERYQKRVILIETAYPWTLLWNDNQHNQVGLPSHTLPGYPATPKGQADFLATMWDVVPDGVCYWAAEWIAAPGFGSSFENVALFDFEGDVLPAARVLGSGPTSADPTVPIDARELEVFPNPFQLSEAAVTVRIPGGDCTEVQVFDALGRLVHMSPRNCAETVQLLGLRPVPGVYWVRIQGYQAAPFIVTP